jgi:hypothetical protein
MKHIISTTPFIKQVKEIRKAMIENIIELMNEHKVSEVYCYLDSTPIINHDILGDVSTLDSIEVVAGELIFNGSNEYNNGSINAVHIDIEYLVEIYNWVNDYKDELFNENS